MLNNISHSLQPSRGSVNFIWAQLYTVVNTLSHFILIVAQQVRSLRSAYPVSGGIEPGHRECARPQHCMDQVAVPGRKVHAGNGTPLTHTCPVPGKGLPGY